MDPLKTIKTLLSIADREYEDFKEKILEWAERERPEFDQETENKEFYLSYCRLKDAIVSMVTFSDVIMTVERLERT